MIARPTLNREQILVYRECPCGMWCATGEGSNAPRCWECGEPMVPVRDIPGPGVSPQGYAFSACLRLESDAVRAVNATKQPVAFLDDPGRLYPAERVRETVDLLFPQAA